jgi:hypothetical protein
MNQTIKIIQYISLLITFIGFIYYLLYLKRHEAKLQIYSRIFLCISLILLILTYILVLINWKDYTKSKDEMIINIIQTGLLFIPITIIDIILVLK